MSHGVLEILQVEPMNVEFGHCGLKNFDGWWTNWSRMVKKYQYRKERLPLPSDIDVVSSVTIVVRSKQLLEMPLLNSFFYINNLINFILLYTVLFCLWYDTLS
jgi:hypothetical protein